MNLIQLELRKRKYCAFIWNKKNRDSVSQTFDFLQLYLKEWLRYIMVQEQQRLEPIVSLLKLQRGAIYVDVPYTYCWTGNIILAVCVGLRKKFLYMHWCKLITRCGSRTEFSATTSVVDFRSSRWKNSFYKFNPVTFSKFGNREEGLMPWDRRIWR